MPLFYHNKYKVILVVVSQKKKHTKSNTNRNIATIQKHNRVAIFRDLGGVWFLLGTCVLVGVVDVWVCRFVMVWCFVWSVVGVVDVCTLGWCVFVVFVLRSVGVWLMCCWCCVVVQMCCVSWLM